VKAEWIKVRALPTPRWLLFAMGVCFIGGIAASIGWGVGEDATVLDIAIGLPSIVCSLIFGTWLFGLECGQGTLKRVVAAQPNRMLLIGAKVSTMTIVVVAVTAIVLLIGVLVFGLAGMGHEREFQSDQVVRLCLGTVTGNWIYAVTALSMAMLTRSMAGGLAISLVMFFVINVGLLFIPVVGDYTLGVVMGDVIGAIRGDSSLSNPLGVSTAVLIAWLVIFFAAGTFRTLEQEIR